MSKQVWTRSAKVSLKYKLSTQPASHTASNKRERESKRERKSDWELENKREREIDREGGRASREGNGSEKE